MIKSPQEISEKEMLRNWALAETASIRRWKYLGEILPQEILKKAQDGQYDFSEKEWNKLDEMIRHFRRSLLDPLLQLEMRWYQGTLSVEDLKDLEIMNWPAFVSLAGSRKFIDLVKAFREGKMPPNHSEFAANLERIKNDFSLDKMKGIPIMVSYNIESPYMLLEGFTRLSAILLNVLENKLDIKETPIILGVSERLNEWDSARVLDE